MDNQTYKTHSALKMAMIGPSCICLYFIFLAIKSESFLHIEMNDPRSFILPSSLGLVLLINILLLYINSKKIGLSVTFNDDQLVLKRNEKVLEKINKNSVKDLSYSKTSVNLLIRLKNNEVIKLPMCFEKPNALIRDLKEWAQMEITK